MSNISNFLLWTNINFSVYPNHNMHDRKDSRLPEQLQRAMAAEAEAAREARAKIVRANGKTFILKLSSSCVYSLEFTNHWCWTVSLLLLIGEQKATKALREAADVLAESPSALQLRYLQVIKCLLFQSSPLAFTLDRQII